MKYDTETFIERAKEKHGENKFNYKLVKCEKARDYVKIICPKPDHGKFSQQASEHIKGRGCAKCAIEGKRGENKNIEEETKKWIKRAVEVHGDKYDYSSVRYINATTKVTIKCKEHKRPFDKFPNNHILAKQGCPKCSLLKEKEQFIIDAKRVHGDKYDYSNVIYKGSGVLVNIDCPKPEHGNFKQRPNNHVSSKQGCPKCAKDALSAKYTIEDFIRDAQKVHGNAYDYSNVNYVNMETKIKIKCERNHTFTTTPHSHIGHSSGCPSCFRETGLSKGEQYITKSLDKTNIYYECQYPLFIKGKKNPKRFDFYLEKIGIFIEFNGIQHYKPVRYFGGVPKFMNTILSDGYKIRHARNTKNIILIFTNVKQWDEIKDTIINISENINSEDKEKRKMAFKCRADLKNTVMEKQIIAHHNRVNTYLRENEDEIIDGLFQL
jgi:hypothetical protein